MAKHIWYAPQGDTIELMVLEPYRGHLSRPVTGIDRYGRPVYGEEEYAEAGDTVVVETTRAEALIATGRFAPLGTVAAPPVGTLHDWDPSADESRKVTLRALRPFRGTLSRITGRTAEMAGYPGAMPVEGFAAAHDTVSVDFERVAGLLATGAFELVEVTDELSG